MNLITWYITNHSTVCSWRGSCSWSLCLRCCPRPRQSARCSWGCPGGCHPPGRSTVQYITVQYSTVQCPGVWHPPGRSVAAPSRGGQHWTRTPVQLFVVTSCLEQSLWTLLIIRWTNPPLLGSSTGACMPCMLRDVSMASDSEKLSNFPDTLSIVSSIWYWSSEI